MSDQQTDELRDNIADTRQEMTRTIEQIEEKLNPDTLEAQVTEIVRRVTDQVMGELQEKTASLSSAISEQIDSALHGVVSTKLDQMLTQIGSAASGAGGSLRDLLTKNPVPMALAALGIGLFAAEGDQLKRALQSEDGTSPIDSVKAMLGERGAQMGAAVTNLSDQAASTVNTARDKIAQSATDAKAPSSPLGAMFGEQSLLPGLLSLGIGIVAGLAMPETSPERTTASSLHERMMSGLDQLGVTDPSGAGGGLINQIKDNASDIAAKATEAVKTSAGNAKDAAASISTHAIETAKHGAQ